MRGISDDHAGLLGLMGVAGDGSGSKADRLLRTRLLFPAWTGGRVIFWCARAIDGHPAKVMNLPRACTLDHAAGCTCNHDEWGLRPTPGCAGSGDALLGLHLVRPGDRVIVVEGPVDAAVGGPGFVAIFGAQMHAPQAAALAAASPGQIVVMLDGDAAGRHGAPLAARVLGAYAETRIAWMPAGEDPGSLGRDACLRLADVA